MKRNQKIVRGVIRLDDDVVVERRRAPPSTVSWVAYLRSSSPYSDETQKCKDQIRRHFPNQFPRIYIDRGVTVGAFDVKTPRKYVPQKLESAMRYLVGTKSPRKILGIMGDGKHPTVSRIARNVHLGIYIWELMQRRGIELVNLNSKKTYTYQTFHTELRQASSDYSRLKQTINSGRSQRVYDVLGLKGGRHATRDFPIVAAIFALNKLRLNLSQIARLLNYNRVPTPRVSKKGWTAKQISDILNRAQYANFIEKLRHRRFRLDRKHLLKPRKILFHPGLDPIRKRYFGLIFGSYGL